MGDRTTRERNVPWATHVLFWGSIALVGVGVALFSFPLGLVAAGGMLWWDLHWNPRRSEP